MRFRGVEAARMQFFLPALLEARAPLHLGYRLAVRLAAFIAEDGSAAAGTGWWRVALPLFVVWDVVLYLILRRSRRYGLWWRLPLDCLDMAFWSLSPEPAHNRIDLAYVIGVPLAIEGGCRLGIRAIIVPAAAVVATSVPRMLADRPPPQGFGVAWLVLVVGMGMGLYHYCSLLHSQAERERQRRRAADRHGAYLAGQNSVAMGASTVVDAIEGVLPILGRPAEGSALWRLQPAGRKCSHPRRRRGGRGPARPPPGPPAGRRRTGAVPPRGHARDPR